MPRIVTTAACVCGSILLCVILGRSSAAATVEELRQNAAQLQDAAARCRVQMAQGRGCVVRVQFRNNERISVEAAEVLAAELLEEADRLAGQAPQDTPQSLIAKHSSWTGLDEAGLASELHGRLPQEADAVQAVLDLLSSEDRDDVAYALLTDMSEDTLRALANDPQGKALLRWLATELNSGTITDEEIRQVQRVIRVASKTHGRLMTEELAPEVQRALRKAKATLQPISQGFAGLHFDEYALVIDRMPAGVSPEAFLAGILRDPHQAIDDDPDFRYWNDFKRLGKGEPRPGEIYTIDMWGPENGDVVLSDKSPAHFMFTTINTGRRGHGEHPLYGNREFGIESNPDGTVTFYTRGASRSAGIAERVLSPTPQDRTWKAMMNGVHQTIEAKGGEVRDGSFTVHQDPFRE